MHNTAIDKARRLKGFVKWENTYNETDEKSIQQLKSFFQSILVASSSVFGILISLNDTFLQSQCIRLVFALSIVLLTLGILFSAIALYDLSTIYDRIRKELLKAEFDNVCDGRPHTPGNVRSGNRSISKVFQICSVSSLLLSLISLMVYALLITFN